MNELNFFKKAQEGIEKAGNVAKLTALLSIATLFSSEAMAQKAEGLDGKKITIQKENSAPQKFIFDKGVDDVLNSQKNVIFNANKGEFSLLKDDISFDDPKNHTDSVEVSGKNIKLPGESSKELPVLVITAFNSDGSIETIEISKGEISNYTKEDNKKDKNKQ